MSSLAATIYFCATLPLLFYIVYTDLRHMRIYNGSNILLFLIFLIPAPFLFDWAAFGWQLVQVAIVFAVAFLINAVGILGGGDAKFLPAAAPYFFFNDVTDTLLVMYLLVISTIAVVVVPQYHRIRRSLPVATMLLQW